MGDTFFFSLGGELLLARSEFFVLGATSGFFLAAGTAAFFSADGITLGAAS